MPRDVSAYLQNKLTGYKQSITSAYRSVRTCTNALISDQNGNKVKLACSFITLFVP